MNITSSVSRGNEMGIDMDFPSLIWEPFQNLWQWLIRKDESSYGIFLDCFQTDNRWVISVSWVGKIWHNKISPKLVAQPSALGPCSKGPSRMINLKKHPQTGEYIDGILLVKTRDAYSSLGLSLFRPVGLLKDMPWVVIFIHTTEVKSYFNRLRNMRCCHL
jgi:hypothetical protein